MADIRLFLLKKLINVFYLNFKNQQGVNKGEKWGTVHIFQSLRQVVYDDVC